jgi:hypothetical protein
MRIGLIGLGRIGAFHAATLAGLGVDLLVTDPVPDAVARVTGRFGAATAPDAGAVLTGGVDGVVIATAAGRVPGRIRRHLPGLQRARRRHRPVRHRPRGCRGVRDRQRPG